MLVTPSFRLDQFKTSMKVKVKMFYVNACHVLCFVKYKCHMMPRIVDELNSDRIILLTFGLPVSVLVTSVVRLK